MFLGSISHIVYLTRFSKEKWVQMKSHFRKWGGWYLVVIYMVLIFSVSSISFPGVKAPRYTDKIIHSIEYGILTLLLLYAMRQSLSSTKAWAAAIMVSLTFAASDEFHQYFIQGRDCSVGDWLADTFGTLTIIVLVRYFYLHRKSLMSQTQTKASGT